jgi:hypothetical protein
MGVFLVPIEYIGRRNIRKPRLHHRGESCQFFGSAVDRVEWPCIVVRFVARATLRKSRMKDGLLIICSRSP